MAQLLSKKSEPEKQNVTGAASKADVLTSSEIRSGMMVTASLAVLLFFLFMAGKSQLFKNTATVRIVFGYASGLANNAPVHFAGREVGRVSAIRLFEEDKNKVEVTVAVSKDVPLKKDTKAFIDVMGFMGEKFVELMPGSPDAPPLAETETLEGTDPVAMNALLKKGTEIAEGLRMTPGSLASLVDHMNRLISQNQAELDATFKNLNESSKNLKEMTGDLKLHPWKLLRKGKEGPDDGKKHFLFF